MRENWSKELGRIVRFGITGSLSTLIHYGAYLIALIWMVPTIAYTVGYGVGLCVNYVMTTFFTFKEHPSKKNAAGFVASHIVNYLLEIGILNLFLYYGMEKRLAGILVLIVVVPINFLILRFVFVRKQ
ncbi:GtrA family protein [Prevotella sp. E9-3]|uniref:GtrA family protein n=1 Tax=Prevotella sp. E9-3 TaxID=2913621 RepID=UPI001EDB69CD|nr:GtrA family protein [Prevotella sp. E9-3]UKK48630.1 GtrA family protein [Prevotella sp. E9-3]